MRQVIIFEKQETLNVCHFCLISHKSQGHANATPLWARVSLNLAQTLSEVPRINNTTIWTLQNTLKHSYDVLEDRLSVVKRNWKELVSIRKNK